MKKIKSYILISIIIVSLVGCKKTEEITFQQPNLPLNFEPKELHSTNTLDNNSFSCFCTKKNLSKCFSIHFKNDKWGCGLLNENGEELE